MQFIIIYCKIILKFRSIINLLKQLKFYEDVSLYITYYYVYTLVIKLLKVDVLITEIRFMA